MKWHIYRHENDFSREIPIKSRSSSEILSHEKWENKFCHMKELTGLSACMAVVAEVEIDSNNSLGIVINIMLHIIFKGTPSVRRAFLRPAV